MGATTSPSFEDPTMTFPGRLCVQGPPGFLVMTVGTGGRVLR